MSGNETTEEKGRGKRGTVKSKLREYAEIIVTAVVLALIVRALLIQSYHIPSESMEDTLLKGDFLFASKFIYGAKVPFIDYRLPAVRDPRQGDIVIFKFPGDGKTDYIKRCIAVAGQTVEVVDTIVKVDGVPLDERYTKHIRGSAPRRRYGPQVVPPGHIFVMGDNRDNSYDSRFWGPLDMKLLRGKALFIYFSVDYGKRWLRPGRIGDVIR
ncbi:MAG: signal peptidase I [Candidatus Krumholzibacteria bacterium]|nr:signal peptidase I [Candidatus Krumholzibacteria bacterium]